MGNMKIEIFIIKIRQQLTITVSSQESQLYNQMVINHKYDFNNNNNNNPQNDDDDEINKLKKLLNH